MRRRIEPSLDNRCPRSRIGGNPSLSASNFLVVRPCFRLTRGENSMGESESMSSSGQDSRKFRIEGSGQMLTALAQAIDLALTAARATPYRVGAASVVQDSVIMEAER